MFNMSTHVQKKAGKLPNFIRAKKHTLEHAFFIFCAMYSSCPKEFKKEIKDKQCQTGSLSDMRNLQKLMSQQITMDVSLTYLQNFQLGSAIMTITRVVS